VSGVHSDTLSLAIVVRTRSEYRFDL
jgi:hypothetical protein